jgi:hypothetical protein
MPVVEVCDLLHIRWALTTASGLERRFEYPLLRRLLGLRLDAM